MKRRRTRSKTKFRSTAKNIVIVIILLAVAMLFLWPYIRMAFLSALVPVGRGRLGALEERVSGEAVFSRWSHLVLAPAGGTLKILVQGNESVRVGQALAEVGSPNTAQALSDGVAYAEDALRQYEERTSSEFALLASDANDAYREGVDALFASRKAYLANDQDNLEILEERSRQSQTTIAQAKARISEIEDTRANLASQVLLVGSAAAMSGVRILAPVAGVMSWEYSDCDKALQGASLADKDASELLSLIRKAKESLTFASKEGQEVQTGDPVGRVVTGKDVQFYFPVKTEDRPDVRIGQRVELALIGDIEVTATITGVFDARPPGYSVIAGEIALLSSPFSSNAMEIGILVERKSGVIVPGAAIIEKDGKTGVLTLQKTYARFTPVEVLMVKGKEAVVKGISETDEIVSRAMSYLEGRRVR